MIKISQFAIITSAVLLLGAGCATKPQTQLPSNTQVDAQIYSQSSDGSIKKGLPQNSAPIDESTAVPVTNKTTDTATVSNKKSTVFVQNKTASSLSYTKAISIYRTSGAYYAFVACHGTPGTMTMKQGTKFMLDNRDAVSRTIAIGWNTYKLAPYSFAIATAPAAGSYFVTCDKGGAAQLVTQK